MLNQLLNISNEDIEIENEVEVHTTKLNIENVKNLTIHTEGHEQYALKAKTDKGKLRLRVRATYLYPNEDNPNEDVSYEFTIKSRNEDGTDTEVNIPTTSEIFKYIKSISTSNMIKIRYTIPVTIEDLSLNLEVDAFPNTKYTKIDIELPTNRNLTKEQVTDALKVLGLESKDVLIILPSDKLNKSEELSTLYKQIDKMKEIKLED